MPYIMMSRSTRLAAMWSVAAGEPVHDGRVGPSLNGEVERRLRRHRRAVHEEDRGLAIGRAGEFLPEKQTHGAFARPMLDAGHRPCGGSGVRRREWRNRSRLRARGPAHFAHLGRGESSFASGVDSRPARASRTALTTARATFRTSSCTSLFLSSASWLVAYGS